MIVLFVRHTSVGVQLSVLFDPLPLARAVVHLEVDVHHHGEEGAVRLLDALRGLTQSDIDYIAFLRARVI